MTLYVYDCTNVVYMLCVYYIYNYVNKFEARSLFSTSHLTDIYYITKINYYNITLSAVTQINFKKFILNIYQYKRLYYANTKQTFKPMKQQQHTQNNI